MNVKQALAERQRFQEEQQRAHDAADIANNLAGQAAAAIKTLDNEREQALRQQARTGSAAEVTRIDEERVSLAKQQGDALKEANAARRASKEAAAELERLYQHEWAAFAEHAEGLTEQAIRAMNMLREPYQEAWDAWLAARGAWVPLTSRVNALPPQGQAAIGSLPVPLPPFPLPSDAFNVVPRPPGLGNTVDAAAAEPEPTEGIVEYEHVDGRTQAVHAGSEMHKQLAKDPWSWKKIKVRPAPAEAA